MRKQAQGSVWGADDAVSMPQPLRTTDTSMADMEGFCFTPDGIRINLSAAEREGVIAQGYGPEEAPNGTG